MNVLLVSHYLLPHTGGIEVLVDFEARAWARAGHRVMLVASNAGEGLRPDDPAGVQICRVSAWNILERRLDIPWPVFSPRLVPVLWRAVRWCDGVHAHGFLYLNSFLALLFARWLGKPAILTEHAGMVWYPSAAKRLVQRAAVELVGRASVRLARRCIGFNGRIVALLRRLGGPGAVVSWVPNPLDRELFHPPSGLERREVRRRLGWAAGRPKVLFVGRLVEVKGIDRLLQARDPAYDLVFCGRGDRSVLRGVGPAGVEYLPERARPELVELYHAADVLVLPSRTEGFPLVAQEALACGLPVVLGRNAGAAAYRRCAGLHFCGWTPEAIRRKLLEIVTPGRPPGRRAAAAVPLDRFLPDVDEWLDQLSGLMIKEPVHAPAHTPRVYSH